MTMSSIRAENAIETAPAKPVGRPFEKGQSGNPGGRPKGLARRIREQTSDGADLVVYMVEVFQDKSAPRRDRMQAATWLADRGFGRPVQTLRAEVDEPQGRALELQSMPTPELMREMAKLRDRLGLPEGTR